MKFGTRLIKGPGLLIRCTSALIGGLLLVSAQIAAQPDTGSFTRKIIMDGLEDPWTVIFGPDHHIWLTEAKGYRVLRIDPSTTHTDTLVDLNSRRSFPRYDTLADEIDGGKPWPQGGLMGMALHPGLLAGQPFVYVAYVFDYQGKNLTDKGEDPVDRGFHFFTRIVRLTYDVNTRKLKDEQIICDSIPASNDHNGGRLLVSQIKNKFYLFYSSGDMGAGQFKNGGRTNHAQDTTVYEGKILRFLTEPDNSRNGAEAWIPGDNPFGGKRKNAVWSLGHRNPQGLTSLTIAGKTEVIASEHGPFSDDEINIIRKGKNYGHPLIIGYADGNYNGLAAGVTDNDSLPGKWHTTYPLIINEKQNVNRLRNYQDPLKSFFPTRNDTLTKVEMQLLKGDGKDPSWPSLAPSGLTAYTQEAVPGWKNSLLITSLKQGKIVRLKLNPNATGIESEQAYFVTGARYRDITVSTDGRKIYVVTDKSVVTSGPTENKPAKPGLHGALIEFTYSPAANPSEQQSR